MLHVRTRLNLNNVVGHGSGYNVWHTWNNQQIVRRVDTPITRGWNVDPIDVANTHAHHGVSWHVAEPDRPVTTGSLHELWPACIGRQSGQAEGTWTKNEHVFFVRTAQSKGSVNPLNVQFISINADVRCLFDTEIRIHTIELPCKVLLFLFLELVLDAELNDSFRDRRMEIVFLNEIRQLYTPARPLVSRYQHMSTENPSPQAAKFQSRPGLSRDRPTGFTERVQENVVRCI